VNFGRHFQVLRTQPPFSQDIARTQDARALNAGVEAGLRSNALSATPSSVGSSTREPRPKRTRNRSSAAPATTHHIANFLRRPPQSIHVYLLCWQQPQEQPAQSQSFNRWAQSGHSILSRFVPGHVHYPPGPEVSEGDLSSPESVASLELPPEDQLTRARQTPFSNNAPADSPRRKKARASSFPPHTPAAETEAGSHAAEALP
jgi:hypothetical protein